MALAHNRQRANRIDYNPEVDAHTYRYCFMTMIILQCSKERMACSKLGIGSVCYPYRKQMNFECSLTRYTKIHSK